MNYEDIKIRLLLGKRNIIIITLGVILLTMLFTFLQPLCYRSSGRLLVIQNFNSTDSKIDYASASKSTQYLSDILVEVLYSSSFFESVTRSGFNIEDKFSSDPHARQKQWEKIISAKAVRDTGIINIDIYDPDRNQVEQIARAVNYVLQTRHSNYHGNGENVEIKVIDEPITTNWPVRPNVLVNGALALIVGLSLGCWFAVAHPEAELFPKKRKEEIEMNLLNT